LQAGGRRFDPGHVHQNYSTAFYDLRGNLNIVNALQFWSIWSNC